MFNVGDVVDYRSYEDMKIIDTDEHHYILIDDCDTKKKVYKHLLEKYGRLVSNENK